MLLWFDPKEVAEARVADLIRHIAFTQGVEFQTQEFVKALGKPFFEHLVAESLIDRSNIIFLNIFEHFRPKTNKNMVDNLGLVR